jgi:serine/threonine protein kinase/Flp pilus assembly protein TadD
VTSDNWQRAKDIFNSALDLKSSERQEYLSAACDGNRDLRQKVEDMLTSYKSDFMERPDVVATDDSNLGRLTAGSKLGRYEIVRLLGSGGMGEVYLAKDDQLDRKVAIKILNEKYESSEANLKRFIQEAKSASALNHPNILTIHEIGQAENSHYIVSEFIDGKTLREIIGSRKLKLSEILDISVQIASALSAAHAARIIHRDIKPENIIVRDDDYVKVLDFGLVKLVPEQASFIGLEDETVRQNQTAEGLILGTVSYMSPEQAKGEIVDRRTDVFSLGVVMYQMVAGRTPFAGASMSETFANLLKTNPEPLSQYSVGVPDDLQRIISKMLRKNTDERYQTMQEVLVDLRELKETITTFGKIKVTAQRHDNTTAILPSAADDAKKQTTETSGSFSQKMRYRRFIAALSILLALLIGATAIYKFRNSRQPSSAQDLYLQGRFYGVRENREDNDKAITLLERAVALDPINASYHAALAGVYAKRFFYFEPQEKQWEEKSSVELEKAFVIDPNLAEAHEVQGLLLWTPANHFPHEQAIAAYRRAIALDPNLDEAHHQLGLIFNHIGLYDEAMAELHKALELNPSNTLARFRTAGPLTAENNCEEALQIMKTVRLDSNPTLVGPSQARSLICLGRRDEAGELLNQTLQLDPADRGGMATSLKALLSALAGNAEQAEQQIQDALEKGKGYGHFHHAAHNIADAYAVMNRPRDAVRYLQIAADDGLPNYPLFEKDANLDRIRQSPEFIQFMAELKPQYEHYLTLR